MLVQPHFDFWIGKPEAPPAKRWVQVPAGKTVRVRVPMMFRVPLGRGKIRVDVRIRELGLGQNLPPNRVSRSLRESVFFLKNKKFFFPDKIILK
ncbi:MAG: hypothetical protein Ct9H90mP8_3260 [Pseudomonadota bacterium]|nr:MAG: hypothetical protein Ct9H90mP8_3260 [Pseudomonadota bacterium]